MAMPRAGTAVKKRKVDSECRIFKPSWTLDYFVTELQSSIICLVYQEKIAVFKEYNVKRHYQTKHADQFDHGHRITGQARIDRVAALKKKIEGQQSFFKVAGQSSEAATKISFKVSEAIAKWGKLLSDGEFVKDCLGIFASVACPDKQEMVDKTSLSHQTVARRVDELSTNIKKTLSDQLHTCQCYSLGLDESTDVSDTAQLAIIVRGVTSDFEVVEELLDVCPMKGTTKG